VGYYFNDPSGYGSWYVPDGKTPLQAFQDIQSATDINIDPVLSYSINRQSADSHSAINQTSGQAIAQQLTAQAQPTLRQLTLAAQPVIKLASNSKPAIHKKGIFPAIRSLYTSVEAPPVGGNDPYDWPDDPCALYGPGYFYNAFTDTCDPVSGSPWPGPDQPPVIITPQEQNITVTVNNAVELTASSVAAITKSVTDAITTASNTATDVAKSAASEISNGISSIVDNIKDGVNTFLGGIRSAMSYVVDLVRGHIGELISFITDHLGSILEKVAKTVQDIGNFYNNTLKPILDNIQNVINTTIVPVVQAIQQAYATTSALIDAIKNDVHEGIKGFLQLPTDIANSIASIEGTLGRVFDQIGLKKKDGTSVLTSPGNNDGVWDRLEHIGKGIAVLGGLDAQKVAFSDFVRLSEPKMAAAGSKALNALGGEITDFVRDLLSGGTRTVDALKTSAVTLPVLLGAEFGTWIGLWELIKSLDRMFEPFYKWAEEDLAAKAGLAKLPVGNALEAWKRGFVDDEDLKEDLSVHGWDESRIKVLKDLQHYLLDVSLALDMYHRGIINQEQWMAVAGQHGIDGPQQLALLEQSVKIFDVNLAIQAYRWKLIDVKTLDTILRDRRYSDSEITALKETMYAKESVQDVIGRERIQALYAGLGFSPPSFEAVPKDVLDSAARDGLGAQVALDLWQKSYFVPDINTWISLHFRGIRTRKEVEAAFDYFRVPHQFRDDLIRARTALLPWRTIPTMMANGIIDEPYAKQQLQAHGFDLAATEALLKYAGIAHAKQKHGASGDVFGLSVQTAKGYFDIGAINAEQYTEVLLAHGYDEHSAALVVKVETEHVNMLQRKQLAEDIKAEIAAGAITIEQAIAQMDAHQFSPAEKSRVVNVAHKQKRQIIKVPSESELHGMASRDAISLDDYADAMKQQGWSDKWIEAFVKWRFLHGTSATATT
jgi:hypothetical protein